MMKSIILSKTTVALCSVWMILMTVIFWAVTQSRPESEPSFASGPEARARQEFDKTKDPALGRVPSERLLPAIEKTLESKEEAARRAEKGEFAPSALTWTERGSNSDSVGPGNGNTRANSAVTSGRMRAILVDVQDATGNTVLVGGVNGGVWRTTNVTTSPATWTPVSDALTNLAIADIAQDPRVGFRNIMYFATGESYGNFDAVRGVGVFKSTDSGLTWTFLPNTSTFLNGTRIAVDGAGNVYLATQGQGLRRSADGGTTWSVNISPTGLPADICDMELSSTGRLHVVTGIFSTQGYRYTDSPATVAAGTWTAPAVGFPSFATRAEISSNGSTLYAAPVSDATYNVPTIYKSINGGANWAATAGQPAANWANGQGWYDVSMGINPANADHVIVGGLDTYRTLDGGATWPKISNWVGLVGQYAHADQHSVVWYDGGNKLLFGNDGGIFYSADSGTTIRDRNVGLRLKQFYSVAIHPVTTNYFLGGTQDNGVHKLETAGLGPSIEVTGGDGGFVAIDQDQPLFQFGSYVYNDYRRSINGGLTWSNVFLSGSGLFINPIDYDDTANIMYCSNAQGTYRRWTNPQSGSSSASVTITELGGAYVTALKVGYTANRLYLGTGSYFGSGGSTGRIVRVDGANTIASGSAGTTLATLVPGGYVSNINLGTNENFLIASVANYGVSNVWVSTNAGGAWTAIDGNLPDMPVRWAMFAPYNNTKAYIATETGVWETELINGAATVWTANATFPAVRTDMLDYRISDGTFVAATHGRGIWSAVLPPVAASVSVSGRVLTPDGRGLLNAVVSVTDSNGNTKTARASSFGNYRIDDVMVGETYVVSVASKRYQFSPRTIAIADEITDLDLIAEDASSLRK